VRGTARYKLSALCSSIRRSSSRRARPTRLITAIKFATANERKAVLAIRLFFFWHLQCDCALAEINPKQSVLHRVLALRAWRR
jgi:hypothetical protein